MSIWLVVPEEEVLNLQTRAQSQDNVLHLDYALSALQVEMTDEVMDETTAFWAAPERPFRCACWYRHSHFCWRALGS